jgi:predicted nucleic acid-binding protein
MTVFVLDSSAVIRYIDNEMGGAPVEQILIAGARGQADVWISAVQWGEVAGNLRKRMSTSDAMRTLSGLLPSEVKILSVSPDRAVRAAILKIDRKIAYADAFALDLAMDSPDHVLVTADYGFKAVADLARIEFLPAK